jgi:hypothetical protein
MRCSRCSSSWPLCSSWVGDAAYTVRWLIRLRSGRSGAGCCSRLACFAGYYLSACLQARNFYTEDCSDALASCLLFWCALPALVAAALLRRSLTSASAIVCTRRGAFVPLGRFWSVDRQLNKCLQSRPKRYQQQGSGRVCRYQRVARGIPTVAPAVMWLGVGGVGLMMQPVILYVVRMRKSSCWRAEGPV